MSRGARRVTIRVSDELLARLHEVALLRQQDVSSLMRDLLEMALMPACAGDSHGAAPHTPDACAQVILSGCPPDIQQRVSDTMARCATRAPLDVLPGILRSWAELMRDPRVWRAWRP